MIIGYAALLRTGKSNTYGAGFQVALLIFFVSCMSFFLPSDLLLTLPQIWRSSFPVCSKAIYIVKTEHFSQSHPQEGRPPSLDHDHHGPLEYRHYLPGAGEKRGRPQGSKVLPRSD